ncbi:hypothetical protein EOD40_14785 [Flavobacterium sufflavum]|uniref:Uncharacterized protein n=2 Tax=Flavobacterium sufflavum TaxID=1921138 RepID=A0A437KP10_9FLAO|nr:hypothetical protein EOD40_14785 [Flavobacterium sufflavum]
MNSKELVVQIRWLFFALALSFVLVIYFDGAVLFRNSAVVKAQNTFLGLNLFLEILIFISFTTFVVFGIKGFFEMFSRKIANVIIFVSGVSLLFVNLVLVCQIIFQD